MASTSRPVPGILVDDSACDVDDLSPCGGVTVTVPGEHVWDDLVALAVESSWPGLEALSGLPGDVADAVRGNLSAHGQAVADAVASVRTWDRAEDVQRTFAWGDLRLGEGTSVLQERLADGHYRYQVLDVALLFKQGDLSPVRDEELARRLGVRTGERVPLADVRAAVLRG